MHDFADAAGELADRHEGMHQVRVTVLGNPVRRSGGRLLPGHGHTPLLQPVSGVIRQTSHGSVAFHMQAPVARGNSMAMPKNVRSYRASPSCVSGVCLLY